MRQKPNIILGISPGTRAMGWAVLSDGELVDWGVKNFKGKWAKKKENKILNTFEKLLHEYHISKVAMKKICPMQYSRNLKRVNALMKFSVKEKELMLSVISLEKLKQHCGKVRNKQAMVEFLKSKYHEINNKPTTKIRVTSIKEFEAIATALIE